MGGILVGHNDLDASLSQQLLFVMFVSCRKSVVIMGLIGGVHSPQAVM